MTDHNRVTENTDDVKGQKEPAVLNLRLTFSGPVNDDGLDHFTQLLDTEIGHIRDTENQRVVAKNGTPSGGWGYGTAMVLDVERVTDDA